VTETGNGFNINTETTKISIFSTSPPTSHAFSRCFFMFIRRPHTTQHHDGTFSHLSSFPGKKWKKSPKSKSYTECFSECYVMPDVNAVCVYRIIIKRYKASSICELQLSFHQQISRHYLIEKDFLCAFFAALCEYIVDVSTTFCALMMFFMPLFTHPLSHPLTTTAEERNDVVSELIIALAPLLFILVVLTFCMRTKAGR
jgi:hypothetical protein